jgi:hypothetical protein
MSSSAQLGYVNSFRWKAFLNNVSPSYSNYFLSSRDTNTTRTSFWTRGSASRMPIPYKEYSRDSNQYSRKETLFNRYQAVSDYQVSLATNYQTDNYKYSNNGVDITDQYRDPSVNIQDNSIPSIDNVIVGKTVISSTGQITYPNSNTLTYTGLYEGPFDYTAREKCYTGTNLKYSFYNNNIDTSQCPVSGNILTDAADSFEFLISGLVQQYINHLVVSPTDNQIIFNMSGVQIYWREINTGKTLGLGLANIYSSSASPNIVIFKNGIILQYGTYWDIENYPLRIVFSDTCQLTHSDLIEVYYWTMNGTPIITTPGYYDSGNFVPFTSANSEIVNEEHQVSSVSTEQLYNVNFNYKPVVLWFNNTDASYISSSFTLTSNQYPAEALIYRDVSIPNISVFKNGILLVYKNDWLFKNVSGSLSYSIELSQAITSTLVDSDVISIEYMRFLN